MDKQFLRHSGLFSVFLIILICSYSSSSLYDLGDLDLGWGPTSMRSEVANFSVSYRLLFAVRAILARRSQSLGACVCALFPHSSRVCSGPGPGRVCCRVVVLLVLLPLLLSPRRAPGVPLRSLSSLSLSLSHHTRLLH